MLAPEPWAIRHADGSLFGFHERVELPNGGKRFLWYDAAGNLGGVRMAEAPLYGIDSLGAGSVVLTEGEKAADALKALGIPAVGTVCGASSTPSRATLSELAGRTLYLWPDADQVGRDHMSRIATILVDLGCRVSIIDWPDAPPGGDAADFPGGFPDVAELWQAAKPWPTLPPEARSTWQVYSPADLRNLEIAADLDMIAGILSAGGKLRVYASKGAGKTTLKGFLMGALTTGRPFLGRYAVDRPYRCLDLQAELTRSEMRGHTMRLDETFGDSPDYERNFRTVRLTQTRLPRDEAEIVEAIRSFRPEIVLVDTINRFATMRDPWKDSEWMEVHAMYDRLLEDPELGVLAIIDFAQANATEKRMANSYELEAWPSTLLRLERVKGDLTARDITFEKVRSPDSDLQDHTIRVRLGPGGYVVADPTDGWDAGAVYVATIVRDAGGEMFRPAILAALLERINPTPSLRTAERHIKRAIESNLIYHAGKQGREVLYRLKETE